MQPFLAASILSKPSTRPRASSAGAVFHLRPGIARRLYRHGRHVFSRQQDRPGCARRSRHVAVLQIYDRVLASRNETTLLMPSLVCAGLFVVLGGFDWLRGQLMTRVGVRLDEALGVWAAATWAI